MAIGKVPQRQTKMLYSVVVDEWVGSRWGTNNRDDGGDAGKRQVLSKGRGPQELELGHGESARPLGGRKRNHRSAR